MEDRNDVIAKDKESHPDCYYSESSQMKCSNSGEQGGLICETIRNIQRLCPKKKAVTIYSTKEQSRSDESEGISGFGSFGADQGHQHMDPFALFGSMLGGLPGGVPGDNPFPHPQHRRQIRSRQVEPPDIPGEARGPIERV